MVRLKLYDGNIRYYATRCSKYNISELRELKKDKALLYLTCFVVTRLRISNDILTQSFQIAYKEFNDKSIEYRDEKMKQQALDLLNEIENVPHILNLFIDDDIGNATPFGDVRSRAFNYIPKDQLPLVSQQLAKIKPDKAVFQWEYIDSNFSKIMRNIRPILKVLEVGCRGNSVLEKQSTNIKAGYLVPIHK